MPSLQLQTQSRKPECHSLLIYIDITHVINNAYCCIGGSALILLIVGHNATTHLIRIYICIYIYIRLGHVLLSQSSHRDSVHIILYIISLILGSHLTEDTILTIIYLCLDNAPGVEGLDTNCHRNEGTLEDVIYSPFPATVIV